MYRITWLLSLCMGFMLTKNSIAQRMPLSDKKQLSLSQFLQLVAEKNQRYAAEKFNVPIAEAITESAKVFPDPSFSLNGHDNQHSKLHLGRGWDAGLGATIELGGKRKARMGLAKSQEELSRTLLADYFRNLRAEAAIAYYEATRQYFLLKVQRDSYQSMKQLAAADSIRYKLGAITEMDARQSRLEAENLGIDLLQYSADWENALVQLNYYAGVKGMDALISPLNQVENPDRDFDPATLIATARIQRADVVAARNNQAVSRNELALVKANRAIDLGVNAGVTLNGASTNEEAPTPYYRAISAGISVPIKFSNRNKGTLNAAGYAIMQADMHYEAVLHQIETEVTQAWFSYTASAKQVGIYKTGTLAEASKILEGKIYCYKRGETSLLEVLNAQRTYNDVQQNYYQALYNFAVTLVRLELAAGIWDIK